jgi:molybdenum cofactor biosynthesis enzyme MoaA
MGNLRNKLRNLLRPWLVHCPSLKNQLGGLDQKLDRLCQSASKVLPVIVQPEPRYLEIAITAYCNLRCLGCRYGRDFMPGQQLSLPMVIDLLDDAKALGFSSVRFYGGEPLLHPDLICMVKHAAQLGLCCYVTTNGILLKERIDDLYEAGLRDITIGFYGVEGKYDQYVQGKDRYVRVEDGFAAVRKHYGMNVNLRINWLLMRPSCNLKALYAAWNVAQRYSMTIQIDLIHYSLPYFSEGPDRQLQFRPEDRTSIERVVDEMLRLKEGYPETFSQSMKGLRSIPDWLIKGPDMHVACDASRLIWVGADGTVQMCYVTFKLGNLHSQRLRELVFTRAHKQAARDALALNCPNCHCNYDRRIEKYG